MSALLEAYLGFYETELSHISSEEKRIKEARRLMTAHSRKERLAVFLTWNGIIGYTESICRIMEGGE